MRSLILFLRKIIAWIMGTRGAAPVPRKSVLDTPSSSVLPDVVKPLFARYDKWAAHALALAVEKRIRKGLRRKSEWHAMELGRVCARLRLQDEAEHQKRMTEYSHRRVRY